MLTKQKNEISALNSFSVNLNAFKEQLQQINPINPPPPTTADETADATHKMQRQDEATQETSEETFTSIDTNQQLSGAEKKIESIVYKRIAELKRENEKYTTQLTDLDQILQTKLGTITRSQENIQEIENSCNSFLSRLEWTKTDSQKPAAVPFDFLRNNSK